MLARLGSTLSEYSERAPPKPLMARQFAASLANSVSRNK
jgi:hypothetical protein